MNFKDEFEDLVTLAKDSDELFKATLDAIHQQRRPREIRDFLGYLLGRVFAQNALYESVMREFQEAWNCRTESTAFDDPSFMTAAERKEAIETLNNAKDIYRVGVIANDCIETLAILKVGESPPAMIAAVAARTARASE
jgi:hypothetical protein